MKERPILMSAPMVKAILAGQKNMTRRVMKPQPEIEIRENEIIWTDEKRVFRVGLGSGSASCLRFAAEKFCPYGQVGDHLWVRETWCRCNNSLIGYKADGDNPQVKEGAFRPSIHMPRWASRLTLEITGVRAERVQNITEDDAIAEGTVLRVVPVATYGLGDNPKMPKMYTIAFKSLWDKINGKKPGHDWASNPWAWVISFKRVEGEC